jgi:tripartite-type tricarboxylate transporter receptor subunit TctC
MTLSSPRPECIIDSVLAHQQRSKIMNDLDRRDFVGLLIAAFSGGAWAQSMPNLRTFNLTVPSPPGSQADQIARALAEPVSRLSGLPCHVLNRPGAAGAVAVDAVLAAAPESGTLLLGGLDAIAYSHVNNHRKALDPLVDFVPVGAVSRDTWQLVSSKAHDLPTLKALIDAGRKAEGLNYPSIGEGSTPHLLTARLCKTLGIQAVHIPYKESFLPDLIAGRLHFAVVPTPAVVAHIKAARLQGLATLTDERMPILGDVPTIREAGWPGLVFYGGLFLFAPAALAGHAERINAWLRAALGDQEVVARYSDLGIAATPLDIEQTRRSVIERMRVVDDIRLAVFGRAR